MTKEENEEEGNLTIGDKTWNFIDLARDMKMAKHYLNKVSDRLDIYGIQKGLIEKNRRNGERRNENNSNCDGT